MIRAWTTSLAILVSSILAGEAVAQDATAEKASAGNALDVELGGNGAWYSVNYERYLRDDASVRIGAMYMSVEASAGESSASASWLAVPLMFNYLGLAAGSHALELAPAWTSCISLPARAPSMPPPRVRGGAGRDRHHRLPLRRLYGGFLFKAGYTPLFFVTTEEKQVFHWGGMSFGYRF